MLGSLRDQLSRLKGSTSGNATLLVALGMPALMASSGLAVDVAQWYMWQREMQFAADQAALAGAWARSSATSRDTYISRARQEFSANLATTTGTTTVPDVALENYNGGSQNAVRVNVSATKALPFSTFVTGRSATVAVSAKASFTIASQYSGCLMAVNPVENRSAIFGNAITGSSDCGVGALSTGTQAIVETGDSEVALGDIVSAGGIEETFSNNGTIHEYVDGLYDPYDGIVPPSSAGQPSRTYSCPVASAGTRTWTATQTVRTQVSYVYKRGNPLSSAVTVTLGSSDAGYMAPTDNTVGPTVSTYTSAPTAGTTTQGPTTSSYEHVSGNGGSRVWRASVTTITTTIGSVVGPIVTGFSDGIARPQPGVYTNISINCPTEFQSGVYFVSGSIDFGQNRAVTGSDIMFVMTGASSDIHINSTSHVQLTGISATTLETRYGVNSVDAAAMNNMLFFDENNDSDFDINGTAILDLNGIMYMPKREVRINGNMSQGSRCIMLVADTFVITGSANISNFCDPNDDGGFKFGDRTATVRLVA